MTQTSDTTPALRMEHTKLRRCERCVMDTTDPDITFDDAGVCHHCRSYDARMRQLESQGHSEADLVNRAGKVRLRNKTLDYDCIIGVSGGADSSYAALVVKELGLRPFAVHVDNGWNTHLAVRNIARILDRLDIPLYTNVLDWEHFRRLQLAFLKASTPDSEIPTDHAITSTLWQMARKTGVRYIFSGCSSRTESHVPPGWSNGHYDWGYIKRVAQEFEGLKLDGFPHRGLAEQLRSKFTNYWVNPLDYIPYDRHRAKERLTDELSWEDYGGKHHESAYTRFYQGYILPTKFGYDKRKSHLSSSICAGHLTRERAIAELSHEPYSSEMQQDDRRYVCKKLQITEDEFDKILAKPPRRYQDFAVYGRFWDSRSYALLRQAYRRLSSVRSRGNDHEKTSVNDDPRAVFHR